MKTISPLLLKSGIVLSAVLIYVGLFFIPLLEVCNFSLFGVSSRLLFYILTFSPLFISMHHAIATALCFIRLPSPGDKTFSSVSTASLISFLFPPAFIFFFSKTMFIRFHLIEPKEEINDTSHRKGLYFVGCLITTAILFGLITPLFFGMPPYKSGCIGHVLSLFFIPLNLGFIIGLSFFFLINVVYALWKRKITKSFTIVLGIVTGYLIWGIYCIYNLSEAILCLWNMF